MRGKEEKKGERKRRKRLEKEEKSGIKSQKKKKKKKKKVRAHPLPLRSRHVLDELEIHYLGKSKLYQLSFSCKILSMSKLDDVQGLNIYPDPLFCNTSNIIWQS